MDTGGVPLSKRMIWDAQNVFESIEMVRKAEVININVLGNRKVKGKEATRQYTRDGKLSRKKRAN